MESADWMIEVLETVLETFGVETETGEGRMDVGVLVLVLLHEFNHF